MSNIIGKVVKTMDLKESIVLDKEFQNYIDVCDKILNKDQEKDIENENIQATAVNPNQVKMSTAPTHAQQANNPTNILNSLKQMKLKMKSGQNIVNDITTLLNTIQ